MFFLYYLKINHNFYLFEILAEITQQFYYINQIIFIIIYYLDH